jgi:hypothetical protein
MRSANYYMGQDDSMKKLDVSCRGKIQRGGDHVIYPLILSYLENNNKDFVGAEA